MMLVALTMYSTIPGGGAPWREETTENNTGMRIWVQYWKGQSSSNKRALFTFRTYHIYPNYSDTLKAYQYTSFRSDPNIQREKPKQTLETRIKLMPQKQFD